MRLTNNLLMSLKTPIIVTILCLFFLQTSAQKRFEEYNFLGLSGGYTIFDINTDNFVTTSGNGFMGGFTTRGSVYEALDLIYGIEFYNTEVGILGRDLSNPSNNFNEQFIDYKIQSVQIKLLGSVNIIRHHFTIEAGPILNVNGKMNTKLSDFEDYTIAGFDSLKASDLENISRVNLRAVGGVSTGLRNFRLSAQYQYGVTNMFNRYNDSESIQKPEDGSEFEGHSSTIVLRAIIYF